MDITETQQGPSLLKSGKEDVCIRAELFSELRFYVNDKEVHLKRFAREFLALLLAAGGNPVTAKTAWRLLGKTRNFSYSSGFFSRGHASLLYELRSCGLTKICRTELKLVRSCRIERELLSCDYYRMLDGKLPMEKKEAFLPEYPWSYSAFCTEWTELNEHFRETPPIFI